MKGKEKETNITKTGRSEKQMRILRKEDINEKQINKEEVVLVVGASAAIVICALKYRKHN
jgi:hypothetical protein